jgi:hypothetical protein
MVSSDTQMAQNTAGHFVLGVALNAANLTKASIMTSSVVRDSTLGEFKAK